MVEERLLLDYLVGDYFTSNLGYLTDFSVVIRT